MAAAARGAAARSPLLLHHHHHGRLPQVPAGGGGSLRAGGIGAGRERRRRVLVGVRVFARYSSQAQDFSTRLQGRADELPKLVEDLLQTSISTGPRGAFRMAQGIQAVLGVGGEWLNDFSKTANASAGIPAQMRFGLFSPLYLRRLFERMGATYIKLGQFIASAPTLFPAEYVEEFQNCFDRAPSVPYNEIESILRVELQQPLDSVYEYIDPVPIASASIAQVHGARLKSSQKDVVIKVLKPGIEDTLVADLNFIYVVARVLEFLNPELQRTSLVGIVKDIKESMLEEVDFRKEAANIEAFQRYVEAMGLDRQAKAPFVYQHCSTRRVLTMERLYGVPLTDLDSIKSLVPDPELTLVTALNVWFGSLISCESFHADVHAGNLWLLRDGRIGFIDFGIVGRISPRIWAAMEVFLVSFAAEDYDAMASALSEMGATGKDINVDEFAKDLQKIFSSLQEMDTEIIVATARGPDATVVSANVVVDERQMNALFLDLVMLGCKYLMKPITVLPVIEILSLELTTRKHAFGPCIFHLLRMSTGIRKLELILFGDPKVIPSGRSYMYTQFQAWTACSSRCICNRPQDWETEDIFLHLLQEVEINGLGGTEHEFAFLKRLFQWAAVLKTITVRFHPKLAVSDELCEKLISLSSPDTCMKIYLCRDGGMVLYAPVD